MAKVTLNDLSKALGLNEKEPKKDFHYYGTIVDSNPEDNTYQVSINRDTNISVEAARLVGAARGDTVMVTVMANGYATVTGRLGGDLDATDAQRAADDAADVASSAMGTANSALSNAQQANQAATAARTLAEHAEEEAGRAHTAAEQAASDASSAATSAQNAEQSASSAATSASNAESSASRASTAATNAESSASRASTAAQNAEADASRAATSASSAATSASNAEADALRAATSASNAESSASRASTAATNAESDAASAAESAQNAADDAATASAQASAATTAANQAKTQAQAAETAANEAKTDANAAKRDAAAANAAANGAVTSLAITQGVVDQLGQDMDDMQTHVAMMDAVGDIPAGLHVVPASGGYFMVIANNGVYVYDNESVLVAKYGHDISFDSNREHKIGNNSNYIRYYDANNDGVADSIEIVANNIRLGSYSVADKIAEAKKAGTDAASALGTYKTANDARVKAVEDGLSSTDEDLANYITSQEGVIEDLQNQIDGAIDTWYYSGDPTLSNQPAIAWTTDETKENHLRDLYFNTQNGHSFRFAKEGNTYKWVQIEDADAIKALADAAAAQGTANVKKRVFVAQPTPPYDIGDLWVQGSTGDIKRCATAKTSSQSFAAADWVLASKYTDDSTVNGFINGSYATTIQNLQSQIDGKAETYYQANDPSTSWAAADKSKHAGDLWYRTTDSKTFRYTGSAWVEQEAPDEVFDAIDGKAQIWATQPVPPYNKNDLWVQGSTGEIKHCIRDKASGNFDASDWVLSSKYTDDTYAKAVEDDLHDNYYVKTDFDVAPDQITATVEAAKEAAIDDAASKYYGKAETYTKSEIEAKAGEISLSVAQEEVEKVISVKEASGNIVHVEDASEYPALSLKVHVNPIQNLNGYSKPWVGGAGKNLLDLDAVFDGEGSYSADGSIYALDSIGGRPIVQFAETDGNYILTWDNTAYSGTATNVRLEFYNSADKVVTSRYCTDATPYAINGVCKVRVNYAANGTLSIKNPMIRLATEADSTFEPYSNICPISGRESVALTKASESPLKPSEARTETLNGITFESDGNGNYHIYGTASSTNEAWSTMFATEEFTIPQSGEWGVFFNNTAANGNVHVIFSAPNGQGIDSWGMYEARRSHNAYVTMANKQCGGLTFKVLKGTTVDMWISPLFLKLADKSTTTTPLGRTVYGGTLDVVSGVLTDKMGIIDLGTLEWRYSDGLFSAQVPNFATPSSYSERKEGFISSVYSADTQITISANAMTDGTALRVDGRIYIKDTRYTDATAFKSAVSGVQLCYELATPQTYQLTPTEIQTLLGENNVWADAGQVYLKYATMNSDMNALMSKSNADLKITAEGISSEVSKKVGNDEVISKIRQSAETVKIQASKVEIDGTATFNAIKSKADAAYDAKGAADAVVTIQDTRNDNQPPSWYMTNYPRRSVREFKYTNKIGLTGETYCCVTTNVPWNDASGGYPKQTVELEGQQRWRQGKSASEWTEWTTGVGGPNLSPFFENTPYKTDSSYNGGYWAKTADNVYMSTITYIADGWAHVKASNGVVEIPIPRIESLHSGDAATLLIEWRNVTDKTGNPNMYARNYANNCQFNNNNYNMQWTADTPTNGSKYVSMTVNSTADGAQSWNAAIILCFYGTSSVSFEGDLRLSIYPGKYFGPYKSYSGNQQPMIKKTQRIYYRTSSSTAPTTAYLPTAWVTEAANKWAANSTTVANWTTKVTPIADGTAANATKYLYLFTCEQREMANGSLAYTPVLLDDSTTVIDGGNIITGTVTANQLNASSINASKSLTVGALTTADQNKILNEKINVGGRNLLLGSMSIGTASTTPGWILNGATLIEKTSINGVECIHCSANVTDKNTPSIVTANHVNLEWGETYKMSADIMYDKDTTAGAYGPLHYHIGSIANDNIYDNSINGKGGGVSLDFTNYIPANGTAVPANVWKHYEKTFTTAASAPDASYPYPVLRPFVYGAVRTVSETALVNCWVKNFKIEKGNKATDWTPAPEDVASDIEDASKIATDYLTFTDANGLTIGKTGKKERVNIKSSGLNVYDSSDASVAEFGSTARIGKSNSSRFVTNASSLEAYNSSNQKYFEVSASGITFGTNNTVAKTSDIPTKVSDLNNDSGFQNASQVSNTATTAADAAAWSVELETTSIDLLNNTATIKATVYKYGVKQTSGFTRAWYKNGSVISGQTGESISNVTADALYTCVIT